NRLQDLWLFAAQTNLCAVSPEGTGATGCKVPCRMRKESSVRHRLLFQDGGQRACESGGQALSQTWDKRRRQRASSAHSLIFFGISRLRSDRSSIGTGHCFQ